MAINKNHEFEDLDGVKCGIVEKNVLPERVKFLKELLEFNHFTVIVVPSPPPKVVAPPPPPKPAVPAVRTQEATDVAAMPAQIDIPVVKPEEAIPAPALPEPPPAHETFTVGVTDYTFNPINAIFGRMLKTPDGNVVTQAYWYQKESSSNDEIPYYEKTPKSSDL